MKHLVYLSLGSNLGNKEENLNLAIQFLEKRAGNIISRSAFYYTEPWGFDSENGFVNLCLKMDTTLSPEPLLKKTQDIEKEIGRKTKSHNGYTDRLIDIDILLFDDLILNTSTLTLPHPLMDQRAFVLDPLCQIAAEVIHPILQKNISEITKLLER